MVVCRFDDILLKIQKSNAKEVLAVVNFIKEANDETPVNFIKQSTSQGGNEGQKRGPQSQPKEHKHKVGHKGANEQIMFQSPHWW